jgi:beta-lactamase regulating signal transducer with metallopeptidase domain
MKKIIIVLICLFWSFAMAQSVLADAEINAAVSKIEEGFSGQVVTAKGEDPSVTIQNKIGNALNVGLGIIGSIALCVFIYGGIMWMTAGGADQAITKAQDTMIWAALGLFAIFCSYMIVNFLIDKLAL